jgi:hypothetical protein
VSVYTQRFILFGTGGSEWAYTVPAGHRAVIKSFTAHHSGTTAGANAALWLQGVVISIAAPGADATLALALTCAAYAGEVITVTTFGTGVSGQVSGFIFEDPAGPIGRQELADRFGALPA